MIAQKLAACVLMFVAWYYFVIHDARGWANDADGLDLPDLASARYQAVAGARSMMSDSIGRGELDIAAYIVIEDEQRAEVARVTFRDAISIRE